MPLRETRLEEAPERQVSFWWGAYDSVTGTRERTQLETWPVAEFLRRYLQHVPPPRSQTVRHDGLYTSAKREAYTHASRRLADRQPPATVDTPAEETALDTATWLRDHTCPVCGQPLMVSGYLPSSLTGKISPRVPLGPVVARPPTPGGPHAP